MVDTGYFSDIQQSHHVNIRRKSQFQERRILWGKGVIDIIYLETGSGR
jgi:hypothetical protein